jgi:two-component system, OmpR family, response regulator
VTKRPQRLRREHISARNPSRRFAVQGFLDEFPLSTLLTLLEMERRSGALVIAQGTHKPGRGKLILRGGRVIAARLAGSSRAAGRAAVYQMLGWRSGRFGFTPGEHHLHDELKIPTARLLLEAAQWADEGAATTPLAS